MTGTMRTIARHALALGLGLTIAVSCGFAAPPATTPKQKTFDTPEQARPWPDMGVKHSCMGWDPGIRVDWLGLNGPDFRPMMRA